MPIEITPALLSEWKQKAEAATPGPWTSTRHEFWGPHTLGRCSWGDRGAYRGKVGITYRTTEGDTDDDGKPLVITDEQAAANAAYIASANPAVVLALINEIERLNNKLDKLVCPNCGDLRKCCMCDVEQPEANNADQA
jgi:hypothetical protein